MEGLTIRPVAPGDVGGVVAITRGSPEAAQWHEKDFAHVARRETADCLAWVAEWEKAVLGFVVMRQAADEVEILNVAVAPPWRGRGVGRQLLAFALRAAAASGARRAFLEVCESNRAAMGLYARCGFALSGRRARYYAAPVEDALAFSCALAEEG